MKKMMTFDVLPMGFCVACLEGMIDLERGKQAAYRDLGAGRSLWTAYCEHTKTGAYTFVGPASETQWTLHTPINFRDFMALVQRAVNCYAEATVVPLPVDPRAN